MNVIRRIYHVSWVGNTSSGAKYGNAICDISGKWGKQSREIARGIASDDGDVVTESVCILFVARVGFIVLGKTIYTM